jgi:hypothetical protein
MWGLSDAETARAIQGTAQATTGRIDVGQQTGYFARMVRKPDMVGTAKDRDASGCLYLSGMRQANRAVSAHRSHCSPRWQLVAIH